MSINSKIPSERKFGLTFAFIFLVLAIYIKAKYLGDIYLYLTIVTAVAFLALSFLIPTVLKPLNHAWYQLGILLGKVVSPIVMGIIFFLIITPVAVAARLFGRDELRLKKKDTESYWIERSPPGPSGESFKTPF